MLETSEWVPHDAAVYFSMLLDYEGLEPINVICLGDQDRAKIYHLDDTIGFWDLIEDRESFEEFQQVVIRLVTSESMRKTWRAISRRKSKVSVVHFCETYCRLFILAKRFDRYSSSTSINALVQLGKDCTVAFRRYFDSLEADSSIDYLFIDEVGSELFAKIRRGLKTARESQKDVVGLSGKPNSATAKSTQLIRVIGAELQKLYGQPLHQVNAHCVALILDEDPLDTSHVLKLLRTSKGGT